MAFSGQINNILNMLTNPTRTSTPLIAGSDEDDMNQVQSILSGLNQQERQPGIAQTILEAIPQAIAIALSEKPGEMLSANLAERRDRQEREKEQKNRIKQLGAQLQIEDIISRGRERRTEAATIRAETRKQKTDIGAEFRANVRDIQKFNRESGFQEKMSNISFDQNKKLLEIKQNYDVDNAKTQFVNQKELENLRSSNSRLEQKIGSELQFTLPLIYSKYFNSKDASDLYDRISRGEKLTADDNARITKAYEGMRNEKYRQELALSHARSAGTSNSPITKAFEWAGNKSTTTVLGRDAQGVIHELQKNALGEFTPIDPKVKIDKYLNQKETFQYFFELYTKINPEMSGMTGLFGTSTDIPDDKAMSVKLDNIIKEAREKDRLSDEEIVQRFNSPQVIQSLGVRPEQVQEALSRNKVDPTGTSKPLAQMADPEGMAAGLSGGTATKEQVIAKLESDRKKFEAAKIVNSLTEKLQRKVKLKETKQYKNAQPDFKKDIDDDIQDLKDRLEVAYQAHPELRPK